MKKSILIIGCSSKLARLFVETYKDEYVFYGTYLKSRSDNSNIYKEQYQLDLSNTQDVAAFYQF